MGKTRVLFNTIRDTKGKVKKWKVKSQVRVLCHHCCAVLVSPTLSIFSALRIYQMKQTLPPEAFVKYWKLRVSQSRQACSVWKFGAFTNKRSPEICALWPRVDWANPFVPLHSFQEALKIGQISNLLWKPPLTQMCYGSWKDSNALWAWERGFQLE